jgi:hypothetical protein
MTHATPPNTSEHPCTRFDLRLMSFLEHDLDEADRQWMERHRAGCDRCASVVREIEGLVADAASLAPMSPSRDLWAEIAERLDTPVVALHGSVPRTATGEGPRTGRNSPPHRAPAGGGIRWRWMAVAATVLVTASSAITWRVARTRNNAIDSLALAERTGPAGSASALDAAAGATAVIPVADADVTYQVEIDALRAIVDQRFADLDSATVTVLRTNLAIIDQAIADSRQALAKDPNSQVVASMLDRALASKLALMRRVALL